MRTTGALAIAGLVCWTAAAPAGAAEWPEWRGPNYDGTSSETGLISQWSVDGENLIWRADFTGRSTPVVFDGRVCANGRVGEEIHRQEMVACFDAETGEKLWEHRWNLFHTSVPWNRVGWPAITGDPETGYIYVQGIGGWFFCLDSRDGRIVWERRFVEHYGFMEGYGGRTQTGTIDGDRFVITFSNTSWGPEAKPLHRIRAFDKRTGELLWVSSPADSQADKNTQSTPSVAVIDGQRQVVAGNGGGGIFGVEARTGEPVWGFQLSQRGINSSVVVDGTRVYASHSEENIDEPTMGRVVAIDATGEGDVTATHEIWRLPIAAGFTTPALADGRLYVVDNSANLHAIDAESGEHLWELNFGRVGKASPVVADGKIYVTEVNGRFVIIEPGETEGRILDIEEIEMPDSDLYAEIYGSPAIAYGRIYFTTAEGIYCLGDPERPYEVTSSEARELPDEGEATPPVDELRVTPYEVLLWPGETASFEVDAYDAKGRPLPAPAVTWSLDGLEGEIGEDGVYAAPASGSHLGTVVATAGELSATARIRVLERLPISEDFESVEVGSRPEYQMAYLAVWKVEEMEGADGKNRVLAKGPSPIKIDRHITFLGHPDHDDYTIQADLMGTRTGRKLPDVGLINSGYTMELLGAYQRIQVRSWQSELRMMREFDFAWEPDTWYVMKMRVDEEGGRSVIRGKVWPRGTEEPADWTVTVEDPHPIERGAPGLSAYSPTYVYWDNIEIESNP